MKLLRKYFLQKSSFNNLLNLGDGIFGTEVTAPSCVFVLTKNVSKINTIKVTDLTQLDIDNKKINISAKGLIKEINQTFFQNTHNYSIITRGFVSSNIIAKLEEKNPKFSEFLKGKIERGISADLNEASVIHKNDLEKNKLENIKCKPVIDGRSVSKYNLLYADKYIIYLNRNDEIDNYPFIKNYLLTFKDKIKCKEVLKGNHPWFALHRPRDENIFSSPKLVGLTTTNQIIVSIDFDGYYSMDSLYNINLNLGKYNISYFATLLNSNLITFIYRYLAQEENRILPQVKAENLYSIPISRISFTTPTDRRATLVEEAKALYFEYLSTPAVADNLLDFVVQRLEAQPEESDVIHDLLAYLAERMIEMNKEKNAEIKSFLGFLEGEIGAAVDEMTNKTAVREYYNHEFQKLIDILVKNKKKLRDGYDPKSPTNYRHLNEWYDDSRDKLQPLMGRIEATDELIDQIVYRLYGLTEEEIEIVEKSIR